MAPERPTSTTQVNAQGSDKSRHIRVYLYLISINLILCTRVSLISIHPKIQEHQPRSGLLQSSNHPLHHVPYWSAVSHEPDRSCNPSLLSIITHITAPTLAPGNSTAPAPTSAPPSKSGPFLDSENFTGLLVFVLYLLNSSICNSSNSQVDKLTLSGSDSMTLGDTTTNGASDEDGQPRQAVDNEKEGVQYSYSCFHLMLCLASLYIMMTLTSGYSPDAKLYNMTSTWPAVWVKISSSWVCSTSTSGPWWLLLSSLTGTSAELVSAKDAATVPLPTSPTGESLSARVCE
uniref:Serine incorporator 3 n=1 Tax=Prolemur simus TaxID=1328070 RepID=A0A8C9ACE3_PROSS